METGVIPNVTCEKTEPWGDEPTRDDSAPRAPARAVWWPHDTAFLCDDTSRAPTRLCVGKVTAPAKSRNSARRGCPSAAVADEFPTSTDEDSHRPVHVCESARAARAASAWQRRKRSSRQ